MMSCDSRYAGRYHHMATLRLALHFEVRVSDIRRTSIPLGRWIISCDCDWDVSGFVKEEFDVIVVGW